MAISAAAWPTQGPYYLWSELHQLLAELPRSQPPAAPSPAAASGYQDSLSLSSQAASHFICQLYDPTYNPEAPAATADCGPTSLAMVLETFGKAPAAANPEDLIDQVRQTMTGSVDHNADTTPGQILSAAQQYGLSGYPVSNLGQIQAALGQGKLVVLAGNPAAYNTGLSAQQYYPFSGGHYIVVTAINGDTATIEDPLSHVGALTIRTAQLQQYMAYQGWNTGIALGN